MATVTFNVRTIGPEPTGATPIDEEDLRGLIPEFIATRADLNQVEYENILRYLPEAQRRARGKPEVVLSYGFMMGLHRGMFCDVWRWAGTLRRRETNIGVDPSLIAPHSMQILGDANYWHENGVFSPDELAARIHARLVQVHPFPNGNGRSTRLIADLYLYSIGIDAFTWGSETLDIDGTTRQLYLECLLESLGADDFSRLVHFARS